MPSEIKRYQLHQSPFYKLKNKRKLAGLLRVSPQELRALSKKADFGNCSGPLALCASVGWGDEVAFPLDGGAHL